ncbi:MAG TPA: guanine deaminase [Pseudonocardiaceae bacterium]
MGQPCQQAPNGEVAVRGPLFWFRDDPSHADGAAAVVYESDGVVLCRDGHVLATGPWPALRGQVDMPVHHYPNHLITAGFVDAHVHYPQTRILGGHAGGLTDWLERHAYPEEERFSDLEHARSTAGVFCDKLLSNGTTTALAFCTQHPESVDALLTETSARGMRMVAGKVLMDRNAPEPLLDGADHGYEVSSALARRWHGHGRTGYAVIPRFAPACSPAQLEVAATVRREHPGVLVHSHIAETTEEVAQVGRLFPDRDGYLDVYEHHRLTGPGTVLAHAVHLTSAELARCKDTGTALVHCPTSNLFLGSGLFDLPTALDPAQPVTLGLGTDVGAGTSFSMLTTLGAAHQVARLRGWSLDPLRGFYLATLGGAHALGLADHVGSLAPGHEADIVVLDPAATAPLARCTDRAESLTDLLFGLAVLGDERAVHATYVAGHQI